MNVDFGDVPTWVAAAVALGAAGVAVWQAVSARRQAQSAREQVLSARQQAEAAKEQVKIMQDDRHDRRTPKFTLVEAVDANDEHGFRATKLVILMNEGPPLGPVGVSVQGAYMGYVYDPHSPYGSTSGSPEVELHMRPGHTNTIYVVCKDGHVGSSGIVQLTCAEHGGDHDTWTVDLGFEVATAPPEPRRRRW